MPLTERRRTTASRQHGFPEDAEPKIMRALQECLHWLLEIIRLEDGASGRVLVNERSPDPAEPLRRVLAALTPTGEA